MVSRSQDKSSSKSNSKNTNTSIPLYSSPVKTGPQSNYGNNRWEVYSRKLGRNVVMYSNLEFDHWVLIECNSEIETFCEQPLKIKISLPQGEVTTTFDIWIKWKSGMEEFREIKYRSELDNSPCGSRTARQIKAQQKWCELQNKKYTVVTDEVIRANQIYLSNWKLILRHLSNTQSTELTSYRERVILQIVDTGPTTLEEIERLLGDVDPLVVRNVVFELLYNRQLTTSISDKPFAMNSILELYK